MSSYLIVERKSSVDAGDEREFAASFERITAGGYSPAAEQGFCPDRLPTADEKRNNQSDELTTDDKTAAEMAASFAIESSPVIVDKSTGDPELDAAIAAFRKRQPAWLRKAGRK